MNHMVEHVDKASNNYKLMDTWTLWAHLPHDTDWSLESYKKIYEISSIKDALIFQAFTGISGVWYFRL